MPVTGVRMPANYPAGRPLKARRPPSPWANPEKSLRKGSLVPRAGTKVSLHKCED